MIKSQKHNAPIMHYCYYINIHLEYHCSCFKRIFIFVIVITKKKNNLMETHGN